MSLYLKITRQCNTEVMKKKLPFSEFSEIAAEGELELTFCEMFRANGEPYNPRHQKAEQQRYAMRAIIWILSLFILCGREDNKQTSQPPQNPSEAFTEAPATVEWKGYAFGDFVDILTPPANQEF